MENGVTEAAPQVKRRRKRRPTHRFTREEHIARETAFRAKLQAVLKYEPLKLAIRSYES